MKTKRILIVANWKMNPDSVDKAKNLLKSTKESAKCLKNIKVIICPPFVYLSDLEKMLSSKLESIILGAQDMFWEKEGSYTGEISSKMLVNERYVILGHSERRDLGETDEMVSKKVLTAIKSGLKPILCIGEKVRDVHGDYLHFLRMQIINSLSKIPKKFLNKIIIAYEPIWAIGKEADGAMKSSEVYEMSIFIKKTLVEIYGQITDISIPILYGGSVNYKNAQDLIVQGKIQGLLIGRDSLNIRKFKQLLEGVEKI